MNSLEKYAAKRKVTERLAQALYGKKPHGRSMIRGALAGGLLSGGNTGGVIAGGLIGKLKDKAAIKKYLASRKATNQKLVLGGGTLAALLAAVSAKKK